MKKRLLTLRKNFFRFLGKFKKKVPVYVPVLNGNLLENRTALITGGTQGIGLAIAAAFVSNGASVVITGRNGERVSRALETLKKANPDKCGNIFGVEMDVSEVGCFDDKFSEILSIIGSRKVDILVNNAGIMSTARFEKLSPDDFDAVLNTNLKGTFFLSRKLAKYMADNKICGNILNIASSSSLRPAISPYTLSKWGIRGLTLGLAKSLIPYGIVVNGLAPGPTATPLLVDDCESIDCPASPIGRFATAEEIANMAVVMTSAMGRMIVGDIVYMTGGCGTITFDDINYNVDL